MKKSVLKKILLLFISVLVVSCSVIIFNYVDFSKMAAFLSSSSEEFDENNMPMSKANYDMLNQTEKQAYINIFNRIQQHPEYIKIPKLTQTEFTNVFFAVKNDNPDILCFSDSCNMITFMSSCFLELHYDYDYDTCKIMTNELDVKVQEIMQNIDVADQYSAELQIHDYIVLNCNYDEDSGNASNAYGCLIDGAAVCSGYSRAMMLILHYAGIDSMLVGGTGVTADQKEISHMWNIVRIDGEPYHLDVTWDDSDNVSGAVSHLFFNLTSDEISDDHKDFSIDIDCNSNNADYFVREEILYNEYTQPVLSDIMHKLCNNINNGKNYLEIEFSNDDAYNKAVSAIIDNSSARSDMYKIIDYISENADSEIATTHINFVKQNEKRYIRLMFDYK